MQQRISLLVIFLITLLFISACGKNTGDNGEYPYGHYKDDEMIGTVWEVNKNENSIVVDISEWEKRDRKGPDMTDEGYTYTAKLTKETLIEREDGTLASIDEIKKGQKVLVNPPRGNDFKGIANEIILLEMSYEEKYARLLSHIDGFNIVVMYKDGKTLPTEIQESVYENVMNILEGTEHRAVAAWVPYDENYVLDYKEALDIEQFPVVLVFNQEELLFKAYNVDDLYDFFKNFN
ncbi:hypothetical protein HNQ94_000082 [Salirhabdus euzebyi]|uniref:DUF3221 domain-containing protein n=1 Tax=Salirhabdus euzebyi TaxID=394506 RepID=A0A841PXX9_9BACI|nr:hypothetical protein [Salirhabdus euzebyi]MBB6451661.1 hypothetical protein [Salirhabdus euzebyi]